MRKPPARSNPLASGRLSLPLLLLLTLLAVLVSYHFNRTLKLDIGDLGDAPFVSGFYADEADIDYRYRWSQSQSEIRFTGAGSAKPLGVYIRLQAPRPGQSAPEPIPIALSINGAPVPSTPITPSQQLQPYRFVAQSAPASDPAILSITTTTFIPPATRASLV